MRGRGRGPLGGDRGRGRFGGRGRGKFGKEGGPAEGHKDGVDSERRAGKSKAWRTSEDALEASFGYQIFTEGEPRLGWLLNMVTVCQVPSIPIPSLVSMLPEGWNSSNRTFDF